MFLDRCDICHKPKKCKGHEGMVLCDECISKLKENDTSCDLKKIKTVKEYTIYDFI